MPFQENKYHKLSCYAMYKWTRCLTVEDMGGIVSALTSLLLCQSSCQSFLVVSRDYRQDTPGCCLSIWRETAWIYSPILPKWVSLSTLYFVSNLSGLISFIPTKISQRPMTMTASSSHTIPNCTIRWWKLSWNENSRQDFVRVCCRVRIWSGVDMLGVQSKL